MIQYVFTLLMTFGGIITDIDVNPKTRTVYVALQQGLVIEYPSRDTIWDGRDITWHDQEMGLIGVVSAYGETYVNYSGYDSAQHILLLPDKELLRVSHVQTNGLFIKNHKGGSMQVSENGRYLYVASGDGGVQGDPYGNAQSNSLLGKILAYDLCEDTTRILAYGVRNPWKIWRMKDSLYVADVGWYDREEYSVIGLDKVSNLGWPCYEGTYPHNTEPCDGQTLTWPRYEYQHYSGGSSIIGGYVDVGGYLYADHYKDTLFVIGQDTIKQRGIRYLTVIKDGYAGAFNGKLYRLDKKGQAPPHPLSKAVLTLDGREIQERDIPIGMLYIKNGVLTLKRDD